jgi:hypothetical protein
MDDQQTLILAAIGDLEITRRQLILEIQARDERIQELEQLLKEADGGSNEQDRPQDHL